LRSGETEPRLILLGRANDIDELVAAWRTGMVAELTQSEEPSPGQPSFRALGVSLRKKVWEPLRPSLAGVERVFVVPDGSLNLFPLAALPDGADRYVIDDGLVIHYVAAERDLVLENPVATSDGSLLAIGGPSYADRSSFTPLVTPAGQSAVVSAASPLVRGVPSGCASFRSMTFDALPAARAEAESVARVWRDLRNTPTSNLTSLSQLLVGPEATEGTFKKLAPGHRVLHIATHGFFLSEHCASMVPDTRGVGALVSSAGATATTSTIARQYVRPANPLLLSGLALAGANRRSNAAPGEEDGILTAEEVSALDLEGVEWAVLSACDTGLGALAAGEGVLGLRRAFQAAGARTVIMSLWSVEDRATRRWMEALYNARVRQQLDTANAVREASLTVLRDRRARGQTTNPFYWAGFVAAGDWR
jgi:CHAT domain-containing protein